MTARDVAHLINEVVLLDEPVLRHVGAVAKQCLGSPGTKLSEVLQHLGALVAQLFHGEPVL